MNNEPKGSDEVLVFELELDAPIDQVWRALTEPELLAAWLMPNDFVARRGHRFRFTPNEPGEPTVHCQILTIEPLHRLDLSWREETERSSEVTPLTTVSFVVERVAVGTLLSVTHRGRAPGLERRLSPASLRATAAREWLLAA